MAHPCHPRRHRVTVLTTSTDPPGTTNSNLTLLYIIITILVGVLLYLAVRYGRPLLSECARARYTAPATTRLPQPTSC